MRDKEELVKELNRELSGTLSRGHHHTIYLKLIFELALDIRKLLLNELEDDE
ncbi:MAG: hypothetical protein ACFFCQ_08565 [Promethearchaeota archaeon]